MQATSPAGVWPDEIRKFDALAGRWWDPSGPMRELHRMNPLRTRWVDQRIRRRFGSGGVRLLDVGCGAGLAAEAFARMGHEVLGIDAAADAIAAARAHAVGQGVAVAYNVGTAEALRAEGRLFQAITALEVIEHVRDPATFVTALAELLEPDGLLFVSTLNRTLRSYAVAILGAERIARLVPVGTHEWSRFVKPQELSHHLRAAGLRLADVSGMAPELAVGPWRLSRDTRINYIAMGERAEPR